MFRLHAVQNLKQSDKHFCISKTGAYSVVMNTFWFILVFFWFVLLIQIMDDFSDYCQVKEYSIRLGLWSGMAVTNATVDM